jgi:hypothetical protein
VTIKTAAFFNLPADFDASAAFADGVNADVDLLRRQQRTHALGPFDDYDRIGLIE